jgi:hypothetical protein
MAGCSSVRGDFDPATSGTTGGEESSGAATTSDDPSGVGEASPDSSDDDDGDAADGELVLDVEPGADDGQPPGECPCVGTGEGIYLLSDTGVLWTFDPDTLEFEELGAVECPTTGWPTAMAVDRQGGALLAYVVDPVGAGVPPTIETFAIELGDPSACEAAVLPLPDDRMLAGTGYASASAADPCDDLYLFARSAVDDAPGTSAIARVDDDGNWVELGAAPWMSAQLSGTGDGRLFAFAFAAGDEGNFGEASLVELDKNDAAVVEAVDVPQGSDGDSMAFAFWGGDAWFFTDGWHDTSVVRRLDHDGSDGGGTSVVVDETPMRIMGAGVSTCAPIGPEG